VAVERIDPTPEMDAVLEGLPSSIRWVMLFPVLGFSAIMLLGLWFAYREILTPTSGGPNWLVIFVGLAILFGALAIGAGWSMFRAVANATRNTRPERRRYLLVRGGILLHERKDGRFWRHWLVTARGERIEITMDMLEELASAATADPGNIGRDHPSTWIRDGQTNAWTLPDALMLYHRESKTVLEVRDAAGKRLHRHFRYRPVEHDDPMTDAVARSTSDQP
jgi:hypothetical protein